MFNTLFAQLTTSQARSRIPAYAIGALLVLGVVYLLGIKDIATVLAYVALVVVVVVGSVLLYDNFKRRS
jgi:hypothetical protein